MGQLPAIMEDKGRRPSLSSSPVTAYWSNCTDLDCITVNKVRQALVIISCDFTSAFMGFGFSQHSDLKVTMLYADASSFTHLSNTADADQS